MQLMISNKFFLFVSYEFRTLEASQKYKGKSRTFDIPNERRRSSMMIVIIVKNMSHSSVPIYTKFTNSGSASK